MQELLYPKTSKKFMYIKLLVMLLAAGATLWLIFAPQAVYAAHEHSSSVQGQGESGGISIGEALNFAVRGIYYFMLLLASGMFMLNLAIPSDKRKELQRSFIDNWQLQAVRGLFLTAIIYVFIQANQIVSGLGGTAENWKDLFFLTTAGQAWLALIIVSLLGFVVIRLSDSIKLIWALLLLGTESFNGHAAALNNKFAAISFDFIHLASSGLWVGGVVMLLLFWFKDRKEAGRFAERFTTLALISIALLVISGAGMTWLMLPSWLYLIYTAWGKWLLAKSFLVLMVMVVGAFLRKRARRSELPNGYLLKLDGLLMLGIIVIVGVFTYISPVPHSEPLHHHEMGEELHYTIAVSPNAPGPNDVTFKVWLPSELGVPAEATVSLIRQNTTGTEPIKVALKEVPAAMEESFPGFVETNYRAEGVQLGKPGEWIAELTIVDKNGGKTTREIPFRNDK